MTVFVITCCAAAYAAGVFTGLSAPKIIAWAKNVKAKIIG